jgi:glycyl-tRNA synthetase beta chain
MSQHQLLLEIGCEELPAGFVDPAADFLAKELPILLRDARIEVGAVVAEGTPRRLVVVASDVAAVQLDAEEEILGPAVSVAFNAEGKATGALDGFLRKNGATVDQVIRVDSKKGTLVALRRHHAGLPTAQVLPALLEQLIARIPFKKTMRWGDRHVTNNAVFGRPLQWLLALLHNTPLRISFADVVSGNTTRGHRYHANDPVVVTSVAQYHEVLSRGQVVLSRAERKRIILDEAERLASAAGGQLRNDPELLEIVKNLVEKPFPILGRFEEKFLEVPKELLISEAREHQKYFMVNDATGQHLLSCFVVVTGAVAADPASLAAGNARVLRARFEDGAFYYRRDAEVRLDARTIELDRLVYQRELGTMAHKQARIADVAGWLAKQVAPAHTDESIRCALLCKNDLVTGVVNEFPELQGTMGALLCVA